MRFQKLQKFIAKKKETWKSPSIVLAIFKSAYFIGILLYFLALAQLFVTLSLPIELRSDRLDIYARNISSVVAFIILGQYLLSWCAFNVDVFTSDKQMKWFKVLIIAGFVVSLVKGILSVVFVLDQMHRGIIVASYYFSDVFGWIAMALFYFGYWKLKLYKGNKFQWFKVDFKKYTNVLVYLFLLKAVISACYTGVRFNRFGYAWTFFLCDAIAWLFLSALFAAYTRSDLVKKKMTKGRRHDASLENRLEKAAKNIK